MEQPSILTDLEKIKKELELQNNNNPSFIELSKANDFYNEMVANGTIKKRGYTLRGIDDYNLSNVIFNKK